MPEKSKNVTSNSTQSEVACATSISVGSGQTQCSNTGSNCRVSDYTASIDYLQGTSVFPNPQRFHEFLDFVFGALEDTYALAAQEGQYIGKHWENTGVSLRGGRIAYTLEKDGRVSAWVSVPGKCWHQLSTRDQWRLCLGMYHTYGFKATRIDLKLRDYTRIRTPQELVEYARQGKVRGIKRYETASNAKVGQDAHTTAYLGSRKSQKFLRVYDAAPVHKENAIDWELQLRDEHAHAAFTEFVNIPIQMPDTGDPNELVCAYIAGLVIGAVEFVEEGDSKRRDRCALQTWWYEFKQLVGSCIRIALPRKESSMQRKLDWIDRQVLPSLSVLKDGWGLKGFLNYLEQRTESARKRYTAEHRVMIEELQKERLQLCA